MFVLFYSVSQKEGCATPGPPDLLRPDSPDPPPVYLFAALLKLKVDGEDGSTIIVLAGEYGHKVGSIL